ncbi:MAG: C45 family autoproteolytic acyltransferase/hydrolase [Sphaerobacter sp.]|nr:C45 family autoproteolytic acyltransferase/hydrolase [Sphaerobacter sp.]
MHEQQRSFPFYRFRGTHREIGRQFGEACAELIHRHRDLAQARLQARHGISPAQASAAAARYRAAVLREAPFFDEEIQGIAEGAGLSLGEAYLLQLRAELAVTPEPGVAGEPADECTTFAALAGATADGVPIIGQNADLPAFYREIGVVVELVPDDAPAVLMLTPAGQVSYIGINDRGMGVFANYVTCDGWRVGFPRYLLSRLALTQETVDDAIARITRVHRASSRNLIMLDRHGNAADLETTPTRAARLDPDDGLLVHANHYVAPELLDAERSTGRPLANSRARHAQMARLLRARRGQLSVAVMQEILRSREGWPDALCRWPEDDAESDVMTFASVIARPTRGEIWVAVGPPDQHPYQRYAFGQA